MKIAILKEVGTGRLRVSGMPERVEKFNAPRADLYNFHSAFSNRKRNMPVPAARG